MAVQLRRKASCCSRIVFAFYSLPRSRFVYYATRSHDFPRLIGFSSISTVQWPAHKRNSSIFSRLFYLNFSLCANECFKQNYKTIVVVVFFFSPLHIVWYFIYILCIILKTAMELFRITVRTIHISWKLNIKDTLWMADRMGKNVEWSPVYLNFKYKYTYSIYFV